MSAVFTEDKITDQKRLVRGEHLLLARTRLRARDHAHNAAWRVLMLPGEKPSEEVGAIRSLMPRVHITAVDTSETALLAAIESGVNEVAHCDLRDWQRVPTKNNYSTQRIPPKALDGSKFDLLLLDFCSNVNQQTRDAISVCQQRLLDTRGVMVVTFSYGREVVEVFHDAEQHELYTDFEPLRQSVTNKTVLGRLLWIFTGTAIKGITSVMLYRGASMPMCSVLIDMRRSSRVSNGRPVPPISFVQAEPGDFEIAVTCPDPALLYATPQDRIEALRRTHAAIKASYTRKAKLSE